MTTTNAVAKAWGQEIASRRAHFELSRAELAERLEVSRQMVRLWETGEHTPSARMQGELIRVLGIDPVTVANLIRKGMAA